MRTTTFRTMFRTTLFAVAAAGGCDAPEATVSLQFGERGAVEFPVDEDPAELAAQLDDGEDARICELPAEPVTIALAQDDVLLGRHVGCATPEAYAAAVADLAASSDQDGEIEYRGYIDPCGVCAQTGDEYQCCRCGGGSVWLCRFWF